MVYVKCTVDVICLMLKGLSKESLSLDAHLIAVPVQCTRPHLEGTGQFATVARYAKTAFLHNSLPLTADYFRVDEHPNLVFFWNLDDDHTLEHSNLVGSKTNAAGLSHSVYHIVNKLL